MLSPVTQRSSCLLWPLSLALQALTKGSTSPLGPHSHSLIPAPYLSYCASFPSLVLFQLTTDFPSRSRFSLPFLGTSNQQHRPHSLTSVSNPDLSPEFQCYYPLPCDLNVLLHFKLSMVKTESLSPQPNFSP